MDEQWLRRIDRHLEASEEHIRRGNEIMARNERAFLDLQSYLREATAMLGRMATAIHDQTVAFVASQRELREEIREHREETREEIREHREETREEFREQREELRETREEFREQREEFREQREEYREQREELLAHREEMRARDDEVREEMRAGRAALFAMLDRFNEGPRPSGA